MWREGEGKRSCRSPAGNFGMIFACTRQTCGSRALSAENHAFLGPAMPPEPRQPSGLGKCRLRLMAVGEPARLRPAFIFALEQHSPFECAGTHIGEPLEHPVADIMILRGHEANGLDQAGIQSR